MGITPLTRFSLEKPTMQQFSPKLQTLIESLRQFCRDPLGGAPLLTPSQIKKIVEEAQLSALDLMPWAEFNHPITDSYGRKLVYDDGQFEVMVMSWLPGDFSAIHDHGATQWGAVQCFGAAEHYIYQFSQGQLSQREPAHYSPGMVHAVDHDLIHQMGNSGSAPFLSLHVYGCDETRKTITGNARIFDLLEKNIQFTDGGVFFCLPESQINQRIFGIKADAETTRRHHQHMGDRLQKILAHYSHPSPEFVTKWNLLSQANCVSSLDG